MIFFAEVKLSTIYRKLLVLVYLQDFSFTFSLIMFLPLHKLNKYIIKVKPRFISCQWIFVEYVSP
jgi:type IV secretory pathway component VirB8